MPERPFVPVPHGMRAAVFAISDNNAMGEAEMTFGFGGDATLPTLADCIAVAGILGTWITTNMLAFWADEVNVREIVVTSVAEEDGPSYPLPVDYHGSGGTGTHGIYAPLLSLRSSHRGRGRTGRSYNFMPSDGTILVTGFDPTLSGGLATAYAALVTNSEAGGYPYSVLSESNQAAFPIVSALGFTHFTYQTRRDPLRG